MATGGGLLYLSLFIEKNSPFIHRHHTAAYAGRVIHMIGLLVSIVSMNSIFRMNVYENFPSEIPTQVLPI